MSFPLGRSVLIVSVNLLILAVLLAALEAGARLFFPRGLGGVFDDPRLFVEGRTYVEPHPERGFTLRPGYADGRYRINGDGFRGPEHPADLPARTVILAMGESTTFGWGVDDVETYPVFLNRLLARRIPGSVWTVNAGIPSYSSSQVRLYLDALLPELEPDLVLVNEIWNDILYSFFTPWSAEYLVRQQPAGWERFLLRRSGLYRAIKLPGPGEGEAVAPHNPAALAVYRRNLEAMVRASRGGGAAIAFVLPPFCLERIPEDGIRLRGELRVGREPLVRRLQQFLAVLGEVSESHHVPLLAHELADPDRARAEVFSDIAHPTALGNRIMAKDLADGITALEILETDRRPR